MYSHNTRSVQQVTAQIAESTAHKWDALMHVQVHSSSVSKADQGESPGPEGVHASSPLTVRNGPLGGQDRLYNESVDDCEEEHTGVQGPQHI